MSTTKVENSEIELLLASTVPVSALTVAFANLLRQLGRLNTTTPMDIYDVVRVGVTDEWNVVARTKDGRDYTTTIAFVDDEPYYTQTTLTSAKLQETRVFLELVELLVPMLKVNGISTISIKWE